MPLTNIALTILTLSVLLYCWVAGFAEILAVLLGEDWE
jgi:hypothetical protein